ncbi:MAG: hypothetical protein IKE66_05660 [Hyphomicrobium sp.]|nr:hypothetical protein [Hyphomicrobium sp.]
MRARHLIPLAALFGVAGVAQSWAEPPADPKGRYSMSPVDGGFLRLDTETGAVALCVKKDAAWACEPVKDGTAASSGDLEAENKALKDRIKALEGAKGTPPAAGNDYPVEPPGGSVSQLPTEEEVDKAFDYIEGMYKKLRERIKKFESEPGAAPGTNPGTNPGTKPDAPPGEGGSGAL